MNALIEWVPETLAYAVAAVHISFKKMMPVRFPFQRKGHYVIRASENSNSLTVDQYFQNELVITTTIHNGKSIDRIEWSELDDKENRSTPDGSSGVEN